MRCCGGDMRCCMRVLGAHCALVRGLAGVRCGFVRVEVALGQGVIQRAQIVPTEVTWPPGGCSRGRSSNGCGCGCGCRFACLCVGVRQMSAFNFFL